MTFGARQGKVPLDFLERVVFKNLGAERSSVIVRPGQGMDNAVVSLGGGKVLLATSDPLSVIPSVGLRESGWLSVHLLASDLATSGVSPQFAMFDLNLPPEMDLPSVARYVEAMGSECRELGIAIAGGHTGRYPGSGYTVVGGGTMFAVAGEEAYVTPAMARAGDIVLMTKGAAIGATAVLSFSFPETIKERAGAGVLRRARARLRDCSTVKDALAAAGEGLRESVTSMHDATEGGVVGGLFELSHACGLPVLVEKEKIRVPEESRAVCRAFSLDPLTTESEGALLLTVRPGAVGRILEALAKVGVDGFEIGRVGEPRQGRGLLLSSGGSKPRPHYPQRDKYWERYSEATKRGLE